MLPGRSNPSDITNPYIAFAISFFVYGIKTNVSGRTQRNCRDEKSGKQRRAIIPVVFVPDRCAGTVGSTVRDSAQSRLLTTVGKCQWFLGIWRPQRITYPV